MRIIAFIAQVCLSNSRILVKEFACFLVEEAVEAELYREISKRQKLRKSISAKHNAYIAQVVKKNLLLELPRTVTNSPGLILNSNFTYNDLFV